MRRLPSRTVPRRLRRTFTAANVLSTLAVVVAASGTAFAAVTYTGANIKDSTVESRDVANLTLATTDFTSSTSLALKVKGPTGDTGPQGPQGSDGPKGSTGDKGTPAPKAYTFQTVTRSSRISGRKANPTVGDTLSCGSPCNTLDVSPGSLTVFPRWDYRCLYFHGATNHCNTTSASVPQLTRSNQSLIVTSSNASGGLLTMPFAGTIVLNASATFYTQHSTSNQRLECQLQIARVENGATQPAQDVGVPATVYRYINPGNVNQQQRLLTISVVGATAQSAGVFETQLACRAPDDNGIQGDRLEFIEGNMSVLSTRTNGQA